MQTDYQEDLMQTFAEAEAILASKLPGYESRSQQQALAAAIQESILAGNHLIAEAGCGTGKSIAYLVTAILSGKRAVVATATKALQDQLCDKDLPFLQENLVALKSFKWALLKGRSNYFCATRAMDVDPADVPMVAALIEESRRPGFGGERSDFSIELSNAQWAKVRADSEECQENKCKDAYKAGLENCFAERARAEAKASDVVVVNHALYFTNLSLKEMSGGFADMLGEHDVVIFDEAHECFPAGTLVDGRPIETIQVGDLVRSFDTSSGEVGVQRVLRTMSRPVGDQLVRVEAEDGTTFVSTFNHPVWTQRGWKDAGSLQVGDTLHFHGSSSESTNHDGLYDVRGAVHDHWGSGQEQLQEVPARLLRSLMSDSVAGSQLAGTSSIGLLGVDQDEDRQSDVRSSGQGQDGGDLESQGWLGTSDSGRQWSGIDGGSSSVVDGVGTILASRVHSGDRSGQSCLRSSDSLQDRPGSSRSPIVDSRRGGRTDSQWTATQDRCSQDVLVAGSRVASVEILERSSDERFDRLCSDGQVYNLEVEGWHTYFANGVAVHNCEEYCSSALGMEFSEGSIFSMLAEVRNFGQRHLDPEQISYLAGLSQSVSLATNTLWGKLREIIESHESSHRIRKANLLDFEDEWAGLVEALVNISECFLNLSLDEVPEAEIVKVRKRWNSLGRRTNSVAGRFIEVVAASLTEMVRWIERDRTARGEERLVIKSQPITVAPFLREVLWDNVTAILTSATLQVNGSFEYIAGRLGLDEYAGLDVGTPFDFASQALTYIPTDMADPGARTRQEWEGQVYGRILNLIKASDGRALLLFTSNKIMNQAYGLLEPQLDYTCLKQGQGNNKDLAAQFKADNHSVLFATRSFMTGFDVMGESLSLVVVDKLMFPVPTDPVFEARCDTIQAQGGNPFSDLSIPMMSLILKQAHGRLIRHRNDRGVFALLDPRVLTKGYGKGILRSLPQAPLVKDLNQVSEFFASLV